MNADARLAAHAIQQHVTDELQADAAFDPEITYDKGEAFLRMLEAYLGDDRRSAAESAAYMQAHAYSNATTADLWNALVPQQRQRRRSVRQGLDRTARLSAGQRDGDVRCARQAYRRAFAAALLSRRRRRDATHRWNVPVAIGSGCHRSPRVS